MKTQLGVPTPPKRDEIVRYCIKFDENDGKFDASENREYIMLPRKCTEEVTNQIRKNLIQTNSLRKTSGRKYKKGQQKIKVSIGKCYQIRVKHQKK